MKFDILKSLGFVLSCAACGTAQDGNTQAGAESAPNLSDDVASLIPTDEVGASLGSFTLTSGDSLSFAMEIPVAAASSAGSEAGVDKLTAAAAHSPQYMHLSCIDDGTFSGFLVLSLGSTTLQITPTTNETDPGKSAPSESAEPTDKNAAPGTTSTPNVALDKTPVALPNPQPKPWTSLEGAVWALTCRSFTISFTDLPEAVYAVMGAVYTADAALVAQISSNRFGASGDTATSDAQVNFAAPRPAAK